MVGQFTKDMDPKQVKDILQHNAESIYEGDYYRPLTDDEIETRRRAHTENCIKLKDFEGKKKLAVEHFKGKMKPLVQQNSIVLEEITTRQEKREGILFEVANFEDEIMETYNEHGEFIAHRKMRPEEKKGVTNVFAMQAMK